MHSPLAIVLRVGLLLGSLLLLPLLAAGGAAAPQHFYALASHWWARPPGDTLLIGPRSIQVEVPADLIRYREASAPRPFAPEPLEQIEIAESMPISYDEIQTPLDQDFVSTSIDQQLAAHGMRAEPLQNRSPETRRHTQEAASVMANAAPSHHVVASPVPWASSTARLRELGALDVRLEPWGVAGEFTRCRAIFAVAGSVEVERHFQSIAADADQAAEEVLAQALGSFRR